MRLACQLIIFGEGLTRDLPRNLHFVREVGFVAVEFGPMLLASYGSKDLAQLLSDQGLHVSAFHCGSKAIETLDSFHEICNDVLTLRCRNIICSGILDGGTTREYYEKTGDLVAERTAGVEALGITLSYHHHDWELTRAFGDKLGLTVLMERVARNTGLVIDTYWAKAGGQTLQWIWRQYGNRCRIVHLKDGFPETRCFTALGEGKADVSLALEFLRSKRLDYMTFEQDFAQNRTIEDCITISAQWLLERI